MKPKRNKISLRGAVAGISREAMTVLSCGLSTALIVSAAFISRLSAAVTEDPVGALDLYGPMVEYIVMTVLIVVTGAAIFDVMCRLSKK